MGRKSLPQIARNMPRAPQIRPSRSCCPSLVTHELAKKKLGRTRSQTMDRMTGARRKAHHGERWVEQAAVPSTRQ
eukprot:616859-Pleurochrysis_carterae.AAC.1